VCHKAIALFPPCCFSLTLKQDSGTVHFLLNGTVEMDWKETNEAKVTDMLYTYPIGRCHGCMRRILRPGREGWSSCLCACEVVLLVKIHYYSHERISGRGETAPCLFALDRNSTLTCGFLLERRVARFSMDIFLNVQIDRSQ